MSQILIFGDSIAYGKWDKRGGWVTRLSNFIDEKNLKYYFYRIIANR
ncbi:MAG: hypothetical protein V1732_05890 [Patescibacteria group bacterium]|nr:hypothetical protein [Patescibacteria group bacterium]